MLFRLALWRRLSRGGFPDTSISLHLKQKIIWATTIVSARPPQRRRALLSSGTLTAKLELWIPSSGFLVRFLFPSASTERACCDVEQARPLVLRVDRLPAEVARGAGVVLAHEVAEVVVILNGVRAARRPRALAETGPRT
ncbi:hypothetical protein GCM10009857_09560 [Agromyces soli]